MIHVKRSGKNPILQPNTRDMWQAKATFNPSILKEKGVYHMVYRALSEGQDHNGQRINLSTVGYAISNDGESFQGVRQLIVPSEDWDTFGCEDPRITKIDDEYFIFYTALSDFPFRPSGIKIGLACFSDLRKPPEKHLVTPFNAKAMVLFPKRIQGKYVALLTVNTDMPPSYIAIARFDKKEDIWSQAYWNNWYQHLQDNTLPLARINSDQIEVGAVPILMPEGWLLIYSHIQHYYEDSQRLFGVEAALLDANNPQSIVARTKGPIFSPEEDYEQNGMVPNIVFPSGAVLEKDTLNIFYGAADTYCCLASCDFGQLTRSMKAQSPIALKVDRPLAQPLLSPDKSHAWEAKAVFNPGVFQDNGMVYLLYRAMNFDNTSVLGLAKSLDGISIAEKSEMPIYVPRAKFETKEKQGANSGCEDPRLTRIGDKLFMCYTAYDGVDAPRVALTSIAVSDFIKGDYNWKDPVLISPPGVDDKDAALFPEKIDGKYVFIHRTQNSIVFDRVESLDFSKNTWLRSLSYISPREDMWDSEKIGLCTPPLKTDFGWLILYHGISNSSHEYRVGAMLLDLSTPEQVIARTAWPILEPSTHFEKEGYVSNVVFPCGAALRNDTLFIYYGGADTVVGVATISLHKLIDYLLSFNPATDLHK